MPIITNGDLKKIFLNLVDNHFVSLKRPNSIVLRFGKRAKRRLGSIWFDAPNHTSVITITGYLKNPLIPPIVLRAVIAHELVHYFTGFGSSSEKKYEHAHRGQVIKKEMEEYNLLELYIESEKWIKNNWANVVRKNSRYNNTILIKELKLSQLHKSLIEQRKQIMLL